MKSRNSISTTIWLRKMQAMLQMWIDLFNKNQNEWIIKNIFNIFIWFTVNWRWIVFISDGVLFALETFSSRSAVICVFIHTQRIRGLFGFGWWIRERDWLETTYNWIYMHFHRCFSCRRNDIFIPSEKKSLPTHTANDRGWTSFGGNDSNVGRLCSNWVSSQTCVWILIVFLK